MNFAAPWFLLAAVLVLPLWLLVRRSRAPLPTGQRVAVTALQTLAVLAAVLALAGPWHAGDGAVHRVAVVAFAPNAPNAASTGTASGAQAGARASAQAAQPAAAAVAAWRDAVPHADPFRVLAADGKPIAGEPGSTELPAAAGDAVPDLAAALRAAAAAIPAGAAGEIALFGDARHQGAPLAPLAAELGARGLRLQVRTSDVPSQGIALQGIEAPPRVAPGEAFRLLLELGSTDAAAVGVEVRAGGTAVGRASLQLRSARSGRSPIDCVLTTPGVNQLDIVLLGAAAGAERELGRTAVLVDAPLWILQLAPDASRRQALAATLQPHGIEVLAPAPGEPLDAALQRCSAVLVDDLAADAWPAAQQQQVHDAVLQRGLGLVLAGTHQNLGPGGYAGSPLAPILPVRMPQREERRDPSISLVLIIDTSGSMGGGRVELAKEVARLASQKLQPHDKIGIVEFYGSKRWAAPLQPATNTIEITRALNRLQAGGGTIIYDALEEAYYALLNARTRFQHILVLTDGGVESGPFETLARRMAAAGQTLSTVLIGPQANSPFLLNLAQWGRGRFYACPDRFQLPELQFREPQSALLPAVQERRLGLARAGESEAVAAFAGDDVAPTGGLVEASARAGAEVLLRGSGGEPFLCGWDQGAGRVLVMAGQTLGPQSGELRVDPAYGAFLADLLRSAGDGRAALQPELRIAAQARGARVQLLLPAGTQLAQEPTVAFDGGPAAAMVPAAADRFEALLPWRGDAAAALSVRCGELELARGAAVSPKGAGPAFDHAGSELRQLAAATGGSAAGFDAPIAAAAAPARGPQVEPLARTFALVSLVAFLLSLLLRRLPLEARAPRRAAPLIVLAAVLAAGNALPAQTSASGTEPAPAAQGRAAPAPNAGDGPQAPVGDDEAAIRRAIDAELKRTGDLERLAQQWRDGTPLQRLLLAMAQGDLDRAAELGGLEPLRSSRPQQYTDLLDILGRPQAALAAMPGRIDGTPVERGEWHLRRGLLQHGAGQHDAARAELQAGVAAAAQPAFDDRAGLLAGMLGYFDLALQWHRVDGHAGKLAYQAALRRGLWQLRKGDPAAAVVEYEAAFRHAPLQRDRYFALAQAVHAARAGDALPALADRWLQRVRGGGEPPTLPELHVLLEVLRDLGRARDGLALLATLDGKTRAELEAVALDLALAAGDPQAATAQLQQRLAAEPGDAETRSSLALLLSDLQRDGDAAALLQQGLDGAAPKQLRLLAQTASELGLDDAVAAATAAFAARGEPGAATEATLLQVQHERRQGRDQKAVQLLLAARKAAERPADRLRVAEQLESLGRQAEAIALYREIYRDTDTEDLGLRLAWLLSSSKQQAERDEAQAIFRRIWTTAGSAARRVQAEEHVLDLAAREGTLADLAIELEEKLGDPATANRPAVRDALVKIYTRARDTVGAVQILRQWARSEPEHAIEALEQEARVYLAAEEFKNHERALLQLLDKDPERELDYRQQLAMSALERGRAADARGYLRGLLDRPGEPDQVAIEFAAGVYELAGLHDAAVRLYRRALAVHPERVETFLLLGNALKSADQRERAIGTFQELLLRPLPDDLFVVAVDGLLNMEAPAAVLAAAARAVRLRLSARPDQVFLHRVLQDLLESARDEQGRLAELQDTVVAGGEQRTSFVRELMQEAESRRDWKTFAAHGRTLLLLGDEVPPAVFLGLGEALLQLGELDAAARAFARARLATDFASVEVRMAELYENAGRLAEAERIRRHVLRRKPDDPEAMLAVAHLAERQGARDRALPLYLRLSTSLLPQELPAQAAPPDGRSAGGGRVSRVGGRALPVLPVGLANSRNTSNKQVPFADPFAGVLRCADDLAAIEPLLAALRRECGAEAKGPAARQLAALRLLRQLALAFAAEPLLAEVHRGEDALLAGDADLRTRTDVVGQRLEAGELQAAMAALPALPDDADEALRWQQLRILLLAGDEPALLQAAAQAPPALLPDLMRALLLAGRQPAAEQLLAKLDQAAAADPEAAGAALVEAKRLFGMPVDETFLQQRRLQQALQRRGPLSQRLSQVLAALRGHAKLDAGERSAHLQQLAAQVLAEKDSALAERLLADAQGQLPDDQEQQLVELAFQKIDQIYQVGSRARLLAALPVERGLELLRSALRRFSAEEQRQQIWRILQTPGKLPAGFLAGLLERIDFDRLTPVDRSMLGMVVTRGQLPAAVQEQLLQRARQKLPDDLATAQLLAKLEPDPAARRQLVLQALRKLAQKRELDSREASGVDALLALVPPDDARSLLAEAPTPKPLLLEVALLRRTEQKAKAADALLAAARQRPDDTSLLYQAARFLEGEGQLARAAELYRTARDRSATFYPYQAQQLARIELELGDHAAALAALQSAKDPMQSNLRLYLAALAGIGDSRQRAEVLRTVLQQRGGSNRRLISSMLVRLPRSGGKDDKLAAALQAPQLPSLSPPAGGDWEAAPSDFDLLGWLPEGEACARDQLRSLSAADRDADLGIYRGMLASARRNGHAEALLGEALATLQQQPFAAEALRLLLAAAEIGMQVPQQHLRAALLQRASDRRVDAAALVEILTVAAAVRDDELVARVLRVLLASRAGLGDFRLRAYLPGLLALAAQRTPDLLLALAPAAGDRIATDLEPELLAALGASQADAAQVVAAWRPALGKWLEDGEGGLRMALVQLPWCGLLLATGDADGAVATLDTVPDFAASMLAPHLLGSALPPLPRWRDGGQVGKVADALVAGASNGDDDRRGIFVRLGAVLVARLQAAGRDGEAQELQKRLITAASDLPLRSADWFPAG